MLPRVHIPAPFLMNLLKHHVVYAQQLLVQYESTDEQELLIEFSKGNNLLCDYYFGELPPNAICDEVKQKLLGINKFDFTDFHYWIKDQPKRYRNIDLSDGSTWTLLIGREKDRYIHLHPARYSKNAIRVRLLALKTAMLYRIFYPSNKRHIDYDSINVLRERFLHAPPLKKGGDIRHMTKALELFC